MRGAYFRLRLPPGECRGLKKYERLERNRPKTYQTRPISMLSCQSPGCTFPDQIAIN